jgi:hypothetical protein
MANAETISAPLKTESKWALEDEYLNKEYDPMKRYVYQLAAENMDRGKPIFDVRANRNLPKKPFKPFQNLVLSSQIVWKGKRTNIRYYDGCDSIFVSEQPKEKDVIDQLKQQTKQRNFLAGRLVVEGYDTNLLLFMDICSWNVESPFRTRTANGIFLSTNPDKRATAESGKMDQIEKALDLAKNATEAKMRIHCNYLGISDTDYHSGNEMSEKELRAAYRKYALENADRFIDSYGNKVVEIKYYIDKALLDGNINNKFNANKAAWGNSNTPICDISGLTSKEAIGDRLLEYSQTEEGAEFAIQLKAIYNN